MSAFDSGFCWGVAITVLTVGMAFGIYEWARYRR